MDDQLKHELEPFLERGERLKWVGKPRKRRFLAGTLFLFFFSLVWTAFAVFWELGVLFLGDGPNWFMAAFGSFFVLIGLTMLTAPIRAVLTAGRIRYAVTDRRALLVKLGAKPLSRGYTIAQLTDLEPGKGMRGGRDLIFAVDKDVSALMPADTLPGKGGPFQKAGFVGLEDLEGAKKWLEALIAQAPEATARRSGDAAMVLEAQGGFEAFETKLGAWVEANRATTETRHKGQWIKFKLAAGAWGVIALMAAVGGLRSGNWDVLIPIVLFSAFGLGVGTFMLKHHQRKDMEDVVRGQHVTRLLESWGQDAHRQTPVRGYVDLGDASLVRPFKTKTSPHSGALKTYHRHHWARMSWALADGNMLLLNLVDRVKLKSGAEIQRTHHVRGRLGVNPARYGPAPLQETFRTAHLEVRPFQVGDRTWLCFRGELPDLALLDDELAAVYRSLRDARLQPVDA